jgi:signal transduction histidine kinase/HPt (histidine-containing phosphotransfer) domain-containing protein/ActR/RegA family two-component response regulator
MRQRLSFRQKLLLVGATALLAVTAAQTIAQIALVTDRLEMQVRERAAEERPFFRAALTNLLIERDYATITEIVREAQSFRGIAHLMLVDRQGREIASAGWPHEKGPIPEVSDAIVTCGNGIDRLAFVWQIDHAGIPLGRLYIGFSRAPIVEAQRAIALRGLVIAGICLVVGVVILELANLWLTRPLARLRMAADRVRAGDYDLSALDRGDLSRGDEFSALADGLRRMASEVDRRERDLVGAREEALDAARAKAQFLAVVSHEIRTPLNGVLGLSGVLAQAPLAPEHKRLAETIQRSGSHLMRLLNDVLDYSKLEAAKLEIIEIAIDPRALTESVADLNRSMASEHGLVLEIDIEPGVPEAVIGDDQRIGQVLHNLITNAIKFTPRGSVMVRLWTEASWLVWEVRDTGIGIARDKIDQLFTEFTQADGSISRRFGGTGLGLAISRRLVTLMGGRIDVRSVVDRGSVFQVWLPLKPATLRRDARSTDPAQALAGLLDGRPPPELLVVDDNQVNRVVAESLLASLGARVVGAASGVEGCRLARERRFDLILMDLHMPELDGVAAARAIRAETGINAATPIIAFTADVQVTAAEMAATGLFVDRLVKPAGRPEMARLLLDRLGLGPAAAGPAPIGGADGGEDVPDDLDEDHLAELRRHLRPEAVTALLEVFMRDTQAMLDRLSGFDVDGLTRALHTLKGAAGNIGARRLAELARVAEEDAAAGAVDVHRLSGDISQALVAFRATLRATGIAA